MPKSEYKDILIFVVTLLVANYFWKFSIHGDEEAIDAMVTWWGMDVSAPFDRMSDLVAAGAYRIVALFRDTVSLENGRAIVFDSGVRTTVVWGCSGLKQLFIWTCLMLTVRGGWKHKSWFIPMGWILCHLFNIMRIAAIAMLIEFHPERFELYHTFVFKYLFYGMMFLLWVWFIERFRGSINASGCGTTGAAPLV